MSSNISRQSRIDAIDKHTLAAAYGAETGLQQANTEEYISILHKNAGRHTIRAVNQYIINEALKAIPIPNELKQALCELTLEDNNTPMQFATVRPFIAAHNNAKRLSFLKDHFSKFEQHIGNIGHSGLSHRLTAKYHALEANVQASIEQEFEAMREEVAIGQQRLSTLQLENARQQSDRVHLQSENTAFQTDLNRLTQVNATLLQEKQQIQSQLLQTEVTHAALEAENNALSNQLQALVIEKDQLSQQLQQANTTNEAVQAETVEHNINIHRLEISNEELQTKVRALEEALEIQTREQRAFDQEDGYSTSTSSYSFSSDTESDVEPGSPSPVSEINYSEDNALSDELHNFYSKNKNQSK